MKNSADQGGCYPQRPKTGVDNTLQDLQNSSYPTKAEFNNCFIIHSKYFLLLKGVSPLRSLFFCSLNITQPCAQVFSVNSSIICSGLHLWRHFDVIGSIIFGRLHFWCHWFNMAKILSKFGEQQLVMVNYELSFNLSETGKYFEWIINTNYATLSRGIPWMIPRVITISHKSIPKIATIQYLKSKIWDAIADCHINNLALNQVSAVFHSHVIRRSVSPQH